MKTPNLLIVKVSAIVAIALICTSIPALPSQSCPDPAMEPPAPQTVREIVNRARNAWIQGDADAFASLFTPDSEFVVPGNRWTGRDAIRQVTAEFVKNYDVAIAIERIMIDGNAAVVQWDWQETNRATGERSQAEDAIVVDFRGDRICRWHEYINRS